MIRFMNFPSAQARDPEVEVWLAEKKGNLGEIALRWFNYMRSLGSDVTELLHDGHPTACVGITAFAYVNAFKDHVNIGFFLGRGLSDPGNLLEGSGKFMRHVKLAPDMLRDEVALKGLIKLAYEEMKVLLGEEAGNEKGNG